MTLNCKKIIVAAFKLQSSLFSPYFDQLLNELHQTHPNINLQSKLKLVSEEEFVAEVLEDKENVGICYSAVGLVESSSLNHMKGMRAAIVHNQYIAQMCRKHNNANVCVIGVDCIGIKLSSSLVLSYLGSAFDNEERNMLRIGKMADYEQIYQCKNQ